jgi:hypothetical protein
MTNFEHQILSQLGRASELKLLRIMRGYEIYRATVTACIDGTDQIFELSSDASAAELQVACLFENDRIVLEHNDERDRLLVYLAKEYR